MFTNELSKQLLLFILGIVLAIVIPGWMNWLAPAQSLLLSSILSIGVILLEIWYVVSKSYNKLSQDYELWTIRNDADKELIKIRTNFSQIVQDSYGQNDLFVKHFMGEFHKLAHIIKNMAERRELLVQADHFLSVDNVLDAFQNDKERIWRYTFPIDGKKLFGRYYAWKRYFEATYNKFKKKKIKDIRALLILEKSELNQDPRLIKLLEFFQTNKIKAHLIDRDVYDSLCSENSIPPSQDDFGIYGNRLLFITEDADTDKITGIFTKDDHSIQRYKDFFDKLWDSSAVSSPNSSQATEHVSLQDLFKSDDELPEVED